MSAMKSVGNKLITATFFGNAFTLIRVNIKRYNQAGLVKSITIEAPTLNSPSPLPALKLSQYFDSQYKTKAIPKYATTKQKFLITNLVSSKTFSKL